MIEWLSKSRTIYSKDTDIVINTVVSKKYKTPVINFRFKRLSDERISCDRKIKVSKVTEDSKVYFCQGDKDDYTISNRSFLITSKEAYEEFSNYCGEYVMFKDNNGYYINVERH